MAKAMAESSLSDFAFPGGVGAGLGDAVDFKGKWRWVDAVESLA